MVGSTVLVVEDDSLLRFSAADELSEAGFDVIQAGSADEAIEILSVRTDIRVVLTDIEMPGSMDGLWLAAFVRDRWPPIHIIVTSGRNASAPTELPSGAVFFRKSACWPTFIGYVMDTD